MRFWSGKPIMALRASLNTWAYWLGIGLLVVVGIGSYLNTAAVTETIAARAQLRKSLNAVQETLSTILDAETGQRGYLLTGNDLYLYPYRAATKVIAEKMNRLESLSTIMPEQRSNIETLRGLSTIKLTDLRETIDLMKSHGPEAALKVVQTDHGRATMRKIRSLVEEMRESIDERLLRNDRQMAALSLRTTVLGILANVSAAILFSLAFFVLRRELRRRKRLEEQAQDLARSAEAMRLQSLAQSEAEIETLGQQARDLADFVESLRRMSPTQSDQEIQVVEEKARDLARSVEMSRKMALKHSDRQVESLVKRARALAPFGEPGGHVSLGQSNGDFASREKRARQLAAFSDAPPESIRAQSPDDMRALNDTLEQRVLERTAQLDAANRELESFTYSVSHDLRAPLRAIDGFSRIVLEDYSAPMPDEGKVYLQRVRDSTRQMGLLVDNLLVFSRLGRQAIVKHTVEPDAIVRNCLAEMTKEHEGRQVEIVIGDLPACQADPTLLAQVWANLLSNALKYTRKQPTARIEIGCRSGSSANGSGVSDRNGSAPHGAGNQVIYFVKDNGAGFDMKYAHKLFGVFQRLHRLADFDGTGVGLAIVQRIVERHGGRIWAEAMPNQGATFSFTLD